MVWRMAENVHETALMIPVQVNLITGFPHLVSGMRKQNGDPYPLTASIYLWQPLQG